MGCDSWWTFLALRSEQRSEKNSIDSVHDFEICHCVNVIIYNFSTSVDKLKYLDVVDMFLMARAFCSDLISKEKTNLLAQPSHPIRHIETTVTK